MQDDLNVQQNHERTYISLVKKAVAHPVRAKILKALKKSDFSKNELEELTGESRYNLYHHLDILLQAELINYTMIDNKTKLYSININANCNTALIVWDNKDIAENKNEFQKILDAIGRIENEEVPFKNRIKSVEICFYYKNKNK